MRVAYSGALGLLPYQHQQSMSCALSLEHLSNLEMRDQAIRHRWRAREAAGQVIVYAALAHASSVTVTESNSRALVRSRSHARQMVSTGRAREFRRLAEAAPHRSHSSAIRGRRSGRSNFRRDQRTFALDLDRLVWSAFSRRPSAGRCGWSDVLRLVAESPGHALQHVDEAQAAS